MELPTLNAKKLLFISLKFKVRPGTEVRERGEGPVGWRGYTTAESTLLLASNPSKLEAARSTQQTPVNQLRTLTDSYFSPKLPQHSVYCLLHSTHLTSECKLKWVVWTEGLWTELHNFWGFPGGSDSKESTHNAGELGLIPGLGRYPGGGHGNPLQYSCLESSYGA